MRLLLNLYSYVIEFVIFIYKVKLITFLNTCVVYQTMAIKDKYPYYVLGNFEYSDEERVVLSPHDQTTVSKVSLITKSRAEQVMNELISLKEYWKNASINLRLLLLKKWKEKILERKDILVEILIKESGKSIHYAEGEVNALIERFNFVEREVEVLQPEIKDGDFGYGTQGKKALILKEPYGGVVCIAPFNYPVLTLMIKVIPALLAGNIVIAKPSLKTPISSIVLAEAFDEAAQEVGVDKGVFNVFIGKSSEIGDLLMEHDFTDMVSFTGSTYVGKMISSKLTLKKFHAELGGKGSALVLDDKNIEVYVKEICAGALKFSGQRCDAINRVIVLEEIKEKLIKQLIEEVQKWKFGDPYSYDTNLVPLIDKNAADKVESLINDAISKGAKLIYGYERKGENIITPVILDGVNEQMKIFYEEIFGPVITITSVKDVDEAIKKAKDNYYGLDASIFIDDVKKGIEIAKQLGEGEITINAHPTHGIGYFPFGGNKDSGIGREGIFHSIEEFTKTKTIVIRW